MDIPLLIVLAWLWTENDHLDVYHQLSQSSLNNVDMDISVYNLPF
jgi:hypothetical protein